MVDPSPPGSAFPPWNTRPTPAVLPLAETARRAGHYKWIEMQTFEVLGRWVPEVPELSAKLLLAEHSRHHGWHAELWHGHIPEVVAMNPERQAHPPDEAMEQFVAELSAPEGSDTTLERLVGVYRVLLPRKIAAYTAHRNAASTITDGSVIRSLDLILNDEITGWREGEMLIQSLINTAEDARRAAERQAALEQILTLSDGLVGPCSPADQPSS